MNIEQTKTDNENKIVDLEKLLSDKEFEISDTKESYDKENEELKKQIESDKSNLNNLGLKFFTLVFNFIFF